MSDSTSTDPNRGPSPNLTGFRTYYRGVDPIGMPVFPDRIFMTIVTLALMVGLPAAIAGIFYGIARLGAAWGTGH
jgi:hypothetical protein